MIFLLMDEAIILVFASPQDAARSIEGIDIETNLRGGFDDQARRLRVEWIERPTHGWFMVSIGRYRLVPEEPADPVAFAAFVALADEPIPAEVAAVLERIHGSQRLAP